MKIKRVLQGTALTALAAAAWMGAGSDASAAVSPTGGVTFDGTSLKITAEADDLEIMTSVASVNTKGVKISSWDVYEGHTATVDLSKLNVTKDNYIAVKTDDADAFLVKISAATKKTKATVDKETAKITKLEVTDGADGSKIQVRTALGSYGDADAFGNFDFSNYQYQGASLYIRIPAAIKETITAEASDLGSAVKNDETKYKVYEVGTLPGKEAKINIAKQANGPKVSIDYLKGTVSIPKKAQYRVIKEGDIKLIASGSAISTGDNKATPSVDELLGSAAKGVLEVRTAANPGKKCASKWTRVELDAPAVLAANTDTVAFPASAGITTNGTIVASGASIGAEVSFTDTGKNGAHKYTAIVIKNTKDTSIEVQVGTEKAKILKKDATLKVTKDKANGKDVQVRIAGDKTNKVLAGVWAKAGTITFPADAEAPAN